VVTAQIEPRLGMLDHVGTNSQEHASIPFRYVGFCKVAYSGACEYRFRGDVNKDSRRM
jgi:hypothetical protein